MTEEAPSTPPEKRRSRMGGLLLAMALLAAGLFAGWSQFGGTTTASGLGEIKAEQARQREAITELQSRLQLQESSTASLHERVNAPGEGQSTTADITAYAELQKRLESLEQKLTATGSASANTAIPADAGSLAARISEIENRINIVESAQVLLGKKSGAVVARLNVFYRLHDAVLSGAPYATELTEFQDMTEGNNEITEALQAIDATADEGIPSQTELTERFDALALAAMTPKASDDASFNQRMMANLSGLVTIRKVGEQQQGKTTEAVLARAEAQLKQGALEAAVSELEALPETAKNGFKDWLEQAKLRLSVPGMLSEIQELLLHATFTSPTLSSVSP